jgi:hypothetical protein
VTSRDRLSIVFTISSKTVCNVEKLIRLDREAKMVGDRDSVIFLDDYKHFICFLTEEREGEREEERKRGEGRSGGVM